MVNILIVHQWEKHLFSIKIMELVSLAVTIESRSIDWTFLFIFDFSMKSECYCALSNEMSSKLTSNMKLKEFSLFEVKN